MSSLLADWLGVWQSSQEYTYYCATYLPFVFRLAALLTAFPFALFIALDAIAYGIARTLHLSMSQRRVPRSPISISSRPLAASDSAYGDPVAGYAFDIPTPSDTEDELRSAPAGPSDLSARLLQLPLEDHADLGAQPNPYTHHKASGGHTHSSASIAAPSWNE